MAIERAAAGGGGGGVVVTVNVHEAARHPVLYDNFYFVQCLLDIKAKFIPPVIADQLLTKFKMANYQQAHFRCPRGGGGGWPSNYDALYIIIALTNVNRQGIFV